MENGWVKLQRNVLGSQIRLHDHTAWTVFETLLLLADYKTGDWRGGLHVLSGLNEMNKNTVYSALKRLEREGMIIRSSNSNFTVYHICNYELFSDSQQTLVKHSSNTRQTLDKTIKRNKKEEIRNINVFVENVQQVSQTNQVAMVSNKSNDEISKLYYETIKVLGLPVLNHNVVKAKIKAMANEDDRNRVLSYLRFMRDKFSVLEYEYKPDINSALEIYSKRKQVENTVARYVKERQTKKGSWF